MCTDHGNFSAPSFFTSLATQMPLLKRSTKDVRETQTLATSVNNIQRKVNPGYKRQ